MRVLVTGGAGFVGSHLVDAHVARGDEVVVVDDLSTGRLQNIEAHVSEGRVRFLEGKAEDPAVIEPAFDGVELVYHLAAAVGVFQILAHPLASIRTNLDASSAVFERASARGIRTLFTSTSEVYGKNVSDALNEDDDTIYGSTRVHRWLYAVSKATDEFLALAHHQELGLPVTVVRLFNTTGPRQTGAYGMVVPRVVAALMALTAAPAAIGAVVNVGNPREISIRDLAALVCEIVGSNSPVELVDYESAYGKGFEDMRRRVPDVSRLRRLIGFVPTTPLEDTIKEIARGIAPGR